MNTIKIPAFLSLSEKDRRTAVEALIFSSSEPLSSIQILNMLITNEINIPIDSNNQDSNEESTNIEIDNSLSEELFDDIISQINNDLAEGERPYRIVKIAGGWQFSIISDFGILINQYFKTKIKKKFSQASLETLAIIAYKQPVSKPEIEQIRGVKSSEVVNSLFEKNLIKVAGRSESLGKPLLYATTQEFLRAFGLNSLGELPKLKEFDEFALKTDKIENENIEFNEDEVDNIDSFELKPLHIKKNIAD